MVEVPSKDQDYSKFLPKNLSYDGGTFHQKYYVPSKRRLLKMDPAGTEVNIDCAASSPGCGTPIEDDECRERSSSLQSNSTEFSEDYTRMTDVDGSEPGEGGPRTPPTSVSSDDFSESASLTPLADDDDDVLIAGGAFSAKLAVESDSCKNIAGLSRRPPPDIRLVMNQDSLELLSPESLEGDDEDCRYVTINNIEDNNHSPSDYEGFNEDREFDFLKTERVRRSTSLKTYKTPPGTPRRKKAVRFADALGLDLESVRHILNLDAPPKIPASATKDLQIEDEENRKEPGSKYLSACFSQPGSRPHFLHKVDQNKVMLENCLVDDRTMTVSGTVRVSNVAFHKEVTVRYTINRWQTQNDVTACYVQNSNDGPTDRFSFTIPIPHYFTTGSRMDFCVLYRTGGQSFWDSNNGNNYVIVCYAQNAPDVDGSDNSWLHFL